VPYSNDKKPIMDILKYGADVEVIAPEALKDAVKNQLDAAARQCRRGVVAGSGFEPGDE
jgi:predicted DNA-binding transcriptional regulator YafY